MITFYFQVLWASELIFALKKKKKDWGSGTSPLEARPRPAWGGIAPPPGAASSGLEPRCLGQPSGWGGGSFRSRGCNLRKFPSQGKASCWPNTTSLDMNMEPKQGVPQRDLTFGRGSKLNRRGKPQVLVHVSTYQGSMLVPVFEPQPCVPSKA